MEVFVVCSAAAIIFLVCRFIFSSCFHGEYDREYTSRPYWASPSHKESYIPESYIPDSARASSTIRILEHGREESRAGISPQAERDLVTALANRLLSDESNNLTAEDMRERVQKMWQDLEEALKRANRAYTKRDYAAAARHKRDVQKIQSAMKFLNQVAAEVTFIKKNKDLTGGMVDLHGLYVEEALGYAKQRLDSVSAAPGDDKVVRFIVGKGLHTKDGKAKIRPALENLCETRGFTSYLDPKNTGILVVHCGR